MRDCISQQLGCSCTTECRIEARREEEAKKLRTIVAKRNADMAMMMLATAAAFCLVAISFIHSAMPQSVRQAKAEQENVHVVRR